MTYKIITREMLVKKFRIPKHARVRFVGKFWAENLDRYSGIEVTHPDPDQRGKAK